MFEGSINKNSPTSTKNENTTNKANIEKTKTITNTEVIKKCRSCENNRKEHPHKFKNNTIKTCNECILKKGEKKGNNKSVTEGKCPYCENNRNEQPEKFRKKNKMCSDCINRWIGYKDNKVKPIKSIEEKCRCCANTKKDHPAKFDEKSK
eukprot:TRINITY_DN9315_c0_g1_i1.p1 TRINITY_DN9315_c0_g1~~TRINITY_DN9315_c0_g1_i1.p1  ORF type:complete len:150 (-),score=35.90 TRINITY_DN9315_c0_g1_i1:40-489(-)